MNYYATLGESCKDAATVAALLRAGISCFRLNLSHGSLREKADWIDALHRAERETGLSAGLLIDLRGPEVRTGREVFATMLSLHETIPLSALALPLETIMLPLIAQDLFQGPQYNKMLGIIVSVNTAGYAVGTPIANLTFDCLGTYQPMLLASACVMVGVTICIQQLLRRRAAEKSA